MSSVESSPIDDGSSSDNESKEAFPAAVLQDIPGECTFCRKIQYVMEKEVSEVRGHINLDIGDIDSMLSSECDRHGPLLESLSERLKLGEENDILSIFRGYFSSSFHFSHKSRKAENYNAIGYTDEYDLLGSNGLGVHLDSSWIDEDLVLKWYRDCVASHGEKCSSPRYLQLLPPSKPLYFVDIIDSCLVSAPPGVPYAALSYVWGQIKMTSTTRLNLAYLQRPGALEDPDILNTIPRTVRHAIYLTKKLGGIRYLWIDALCIVQDDKEMLDFHLPQMGSIYANADIVIANTDGPDADFGLHGLRDAPRCLPRSITQSMIPFGDLTLVQRHSVRGARRGSTTIGPYWDRGWTFQEHFFARRCIYFANNSVWFECCRSTIYEDHKKPDLPDRQRDWILDVGYPSVTVFSRLVEDFNKRQLTFPQDCLMAFAGTVPCYVKIFTGGFVCGLPEMFIDAMLLWQPGGNLVRRVPFYNENKPRNEKEDIYLPSWSWAGWQGVLDFDGWYTANDFVASCSGWIAVTRCEVISTTTWYACNTPHDTERRKISCLWTEWRERYKDVKEALPHGWTKRLKKKGERFTCEDTPEGYGDYVYQFNGSVNPTFWYPLPLGDPTGLPRSDADASYLCGEVQVAVARTFGEVWTRENEMEQSPTGLPCISLCNAEGKWIGVLRLHSADYFETRGITLGGEGLEVQLIAISEGSVPNGLIWGHSYVDEYKMEERPSRGPKYEFVNVLWVSWDGPVARREALGRVSKEFWEALGAKTIHVVLG
jgi:hypothetical protein